MSDKFDTPPIRGLGLDLVPVEAISLALRRDADAVYAWLTEAEVEALGERAASAETLAGRVAAKEAVVKTLGCGFNDEVSWQDVSILVDGNGAPGVHLTGGAATAAEHAGVRCILVTITHAGEYAAAAACALT